MNYLEKYQRIIPNNVPRIDFHIHTDWTDGHNSIKEMHEKAVEEGLNCILFSEHVRRGSEKWFHRFASEIRDLPGDRCKALVGIETKAIDLDGNLDCPEEIMNQCDLVIASVHRFPGGKGEALEFEDIPAAKAVEMEFKIASAILNNSDVDILGHSFGMSYRIFNVKPDETMIRQLMVKSAIKQIAFEINSSYHKDPWRLIRLCQETGAPISLGSDAHNVDEVGEIVRLLERED